MIRLIVVREVVLPDVEAESAFFTIKAARKWFPPEIKQQQILGAATARKPLHTLGIRWTNQGGFHANQDQEIQWMWDAGDIERHLERLARQDPIFKAGLEAPRRS